MGLRHGQCGRQQEQDEALAGAVQSRLADTHRRQPLHRSDRRLRLCARHEVRPRGTAWRRTPRDAQLRCGRDCHLRHARQPHGAEARHVHPVHAADAPEVHRQQVQLLHHRLPHRRLHASVARRYARCRLPHAAQLRRCGVVDARAARRQLFDARLLPGPLPRQP